MSSPRELEILSQEQAVLDYLAAQKRPADSLRPITKEDIAPGLLLVYELGAGYGCHIVRAKGDSYKYKNGVGLKQAMANCLFLTLKDDVQL